MFREDLTWDRHAEDCWLLWAMIRGNYVGFGYVLRMDDGTYYWKGTDGLMDEMDGISDTLEEAKSRVEEHVDLTAY